MKAPAHVRPFTSRECRLDEPLLLTVHEDVQIYCLSIVCARRGALVVGQNIAALYYWLFPNLLLNFYPWGVSVNGVYRLGRERSRVSFVAMWDEEKRVSGVGGDLHRVEIEDEEVVEPVQRGVRSRLRDRGRYSPRGETGTHHFHRLLARFLQA